MRTNIKKLIILLAILAAGLIIGLTFLWLNDGLRGRLKNFVIRVEDKARCGWTVESVPEGSPSILFVHHSVGNNLIEKGCLRSLFSKAGYAFWDHGYNQQGLRDSAGKELGVNFNIPDDNTNPDGYAAIFQQEVTSPPDKAFSHMLEYDIILFKSCYPVSAIKSEEQLAAYQTYYLGIRDVMDQYPGKHFVVFTPPPLNPAETTPEEAVLARKFADWLASPEFLAGHANLSTFDFFDTLAEADQTAADANMLREEDRSGTDSHPNRDANIKIAPLIVEFVQNLS